MKYKILVLDIDGTLTKNDKTLSPVTRDALIKAEQQGMKLVLASGRPTYGIAPLADELRMAEYGGYILAFNGGNIINWQTKECIHSNVLPDEVKPYLYDCAKRCGFAILSYDLDGNIITENPDDEYVVYEAFLNKMPIRKVDNFLEEVTYKLPKCLIVGKPEPLHELELEMAEKLKDTMNVFRSEAFFMELVPLGIDKAKCLEILLDKIGMTREEMVACGDGFNDLSMIEYAGLGVAMANAKEPVLAAADHVTLSNEEDGVAKVVEDFFL